MQQAQLHPVIRIHSDAGLSIVIVVGLITIITPYRSRAVRSTRSSMTSISIVSGWQLQTENLNFLRNSNIFCDSKLELSHSKLNT